MALTTKIREYREKQGLTQSELADLVGVRRETIVNLERGRYNPSLKLWPWISPGLSRHRGRDIFLYGIRNADVSRPSIAARAIPTHAGYKSVNTADVGKSAITPVTEPIHRKEINEAMKLGIVGLPNVGKSTLSNALTNAGAESANYPFCTIEPNVGVVTVPDARLDYLAEMYQPKKYTPATIEFVDIAGLVKGASQGEGLGNKFLGDIRNTDAIVHVVRCFDNADIIRHECSHDPVSDIETVDLELILADIEMLRRRQDKAEKNAKSGDKKFKKEAEVLGRLIEWMDGGRSARSFEADEEEREIIAASDLLTNKPIIYAANLDEDGFSAGAENNAYYQQVKALADAEGSRVLPVCARFEQEIAELDEEERAVFMEELGMTESGLQRLIQASYELLGLISFLTAGSDEVRAWTIRRGTKAPQAAGKIHTDFEKGFIRAEIVAFDDLKACGSMAAAKEKGLVRLEGKDYVMHDGDVTPSASTFPWASENA